MRWRTRAIWRPPTAAAPSGSKASSRASTAAASSPTTPARKSRKRTGPRKPSSWRRSISPPRAASARAWGSSGIVGRICTRRCSHRTEEPSDSRARLQSRRRANVAELKFGPTVDLHFSFFSLHLQLGSEVLARIDEPVLFPVVLTIVQLPIAAVEGHQLIVGAALHDLAVLQDQDLVRAANRREAVRDDERRA